MNNLKIIRSKIENLDAFQFGLQLLQAWIRFMECILHIINYQLSSGESKRSSRRPFSKLGNVIFKMNYEKEWYNH